MGYTTDFTGHVTVTPPLNAAEASFLFAFADSRRMRRPEGPYSTKDYGYGELPGNDTNLPPTGQPSPWCNWAATAEGAGIEWNGAEKFYSADAWMQYLIDHFLSAGGFAEGLPGFEKFTFDHVVNGTIDAQGDDPDDVWQLIVTDNSVNKVERQSPAKRLEWLLAEYRALRAANQPVTVDVMDEIAALMEARDNN
jgi:hypothetical protein